MPDDDKRNMQYFEAPTMRRLFDMMSEWEKQHQKRFVSLNIPREANVISCIAITNPIRVVITSYDGERYATVNPIGQLHTI